MLAVGGVCNLIGSNSLQFRYEGVILGWCEGCLRHATSRHTFSGAGVALFCGDSVVAISAVVHWPLRHSCKATSLASSQRYGSMDLLSSDMLCMRPHLEHSLAILLFKTCFLRSQQTALTVHRCKCTDVRGYDASECPAQPIS